jgi:transcriptional regulator with XRE-family HTH domain
MMLMVAQTMSGSGVARRLLGRCLRDLRQEAVLTTEKAARALEWSGPKLWRIETGQTGVRGLDVEAMCALYGAPLDLAQALTGLARRPQAEVWWRARGEAVIHGFDVYSRLEEQACTLLGYEPGEVPPLARTPAYARALISARRPGTDAAEIDQLVRECLARQLQVTRAGAPLDLKLILSEALVRSPVGGPQLMAEQLRYLAEMAVFPNVRVRVVPFSAGLHPGLETGPFTLLRFPSSGRDPGAVTVRVPSLAGELYLDKPDEVECFQTAYSAIASYALDDAATKELLLAAAKELEQ